MIFWIIGSIVLTYGAAATWQFRRDRRRLPREHLVDMLRKNRSYSRKEADEALDAYREAILDGRTEEDGTDWEEYFRAATAAVRELFGEIVEAPTYDDPDDELEVVTSGLKLYPTAHAGLLAHQLRVWNRRLRADKVIGAYDYRQRMIAADFTDPDQETEIK